MNLYCSDLFSVVKSPHLWLWLNLVNVYERILENTTFTENEQSSIVEFSQTTRKADCYAVMLDNDCCQLETSFPISFCLGI